ncbi:MAG: hypothetical protein K2X27_07080 [Candidatus Obscuribacterales bacterium]|nr:hypothetical protein [Candidatus Obscuribacterales bacterium]
MFLEKITSRFDLVLLIACLQALLTSAAQAADWGYDGTEAPPKAVPLIEHSAAALQKSLVKPSKSVAKESLPPAGTPGKAGSKPAAAKSQKQAVSPAVQTLPPKNADDKALSESPHDAFIDKDQQAARCWMQLFQACSKQNLDYAQQKRIEAYVLNKGKQGAKQNAELRSVLKFWPKIITDLREKPEMEMHYADLFRALLRLHERTATEKTNVEASPFSSDADLISELLGLQRVAVADAIPFTEDAVNAYADMAVFIYEQQHSGRTIDANDNRALFAKVVVEKFNRAPTDADRRAMASFDLAWAKFKIIWYSSNESTRKLLLEKLVKVGANSSLTVTKDPLLDTVLSNWPWSVTP